MTFQNPVKTCDKCGRSHTNYGNTCEYCLTGKPRPKPIKGWTLAKPKGNDARSRPLQSKSWLCGMGMRPAKYP